jgi:hypothetical protein
MRTLGVLLALSLLVPVAAVDSIVTVFNISFDNIPADLLHRSGLNSTLLQEKLNLLASTNPEFHGALISAVIDLLTGSLVSATPCPPGSTDPQCTCPGGQFKLYELGQSVPFTCSPCDPGTWSLFNSSQCIECPAAGGVTSTWPVF